ALKRVGVSGHAGFHEFLCLLFVSREVRTIGQIPGRHTNLLSSLPGVRPIRLKEASYVWNTGGWARPFPRTGCAPAREAQYSPAPDGRLNGDPRDRWPAKLH